MAHNSTCLQCRESLLFGDPSRVSEVCSDDVRVLCPRHSHKVTRQTQPRVELAPTANTPTSIMMNRRVAAAERALRICEVEGGPRLPGEIALTDVVDHAHHCGPGSSLRWPEIRALMPSGPRFGMTVQHPGDPVDGGRMGGDQATRDSGSRCAVSGSRSGSGRVFETRDCCTRSHSRRFNPSTAIRLHSPLERE